VKRPVRVLAVDHTAGVSTFRKKFAPIAECDRVDLAVLAPKTWIESGAVVVAPASVDGYELHTGRALFRGYENRGFFVTGLARALRRWRPDVLDLYEEPFSLFYLQALLAGRVFAPRAKIIFHTSDSLSWEYRYPYRPSFLYASIQRLAHASADYAVTINEVAAEILRSKGFAKPIRRAFHGVDEEEFRPLEAGKLKVDLGLVGPVVGYVGRLMPAKGVHVLIEAFAALDGTPRLLLVGIGEAREALERQASDLGVLDRVVFAGGVPHSEVPRHLSAMDLMVLPSLKTARFNEPFGRVLVEAMACGVPVIGTTCGSMDLVVGDAGIIVPENESGTLAAKMELVLGNGALREELSRAGRERVLAHYTWRRFGELMLGIYDEVLGEEGS